MAKTLTIYYLFFEVSATDSKTTCTIIALHIQLEVTWIKNINLINGAFEFYFIFLEYKYCIVLLWRFKSVFARMNSFECLFW